MTAALNRQARRKADKLQRQKPRRRSRAAPRLVEVALGELLQAAVRQHQEGNTEAAEDAYRRILAHHPDHADALQFLGVLLQQTQRGEEGLGLLERAAEAAPDNPQVLLNLGAALHMHGRADAAEARFRRALELDPANPEIHANLVGMFKEMDRLEDALAAYDAACARVPGAAEVHKRMADLWIARRDFDKAAACLGRALAATPDDAQAVHDLAFCYKELGNAPEAEAHYARAVELAPDAPRMRHSLATFLVLQGRSDEAQAHFERILEAEPDHWVSMVALGVNLANKGQIDEAMATFAKVLEANADDAVVWNDVGSQYLLLGKYEQARQAFTRAVELDPDRVEPRTNLGNAFMRLARVKEAVEAYEQALRIRPRHLEAHVALCRAFKELHRYDEANLYARATFLLEEYTHHYFANPYQILRGTCDFDGLRDFGDIWEVCDSLKPAELPGGLLYLLVSADGPETNRRLFGYVRRWAKFVDELAGIAPLEPRPRTRTDGKVRLGFLSSDLRTHAVGRFLIPLLTKYDRDRFEVYCYTAVQVVGDPIQLMFQNNVDEFRFVPNLSDRELAEAIQRDEVDILFELNGFTQGTRLPVLACRPAPVQISWMGYPFSTGMESVDYVLVDRYVKTPCDDLLVEKQLEMPESNVCFGKFADVTIEDGLPMDRNGAVTFGTLNNPYKYTPEIISLWAEVMKAVPGSRFLMVRPECGSLMTCKNFAEEFARNGIGPERLYFINNRTNKLNHLYYYNEIDVSLDTYPLTGGTTTCEATWMGVPVITLYGESIHQRISYSFLNTAGFPELCAPTREEFVAKAVELSGDRARLERYRRGMREAMRATTLCQAGRYLEQFQDVMEKVAEEARARPAAV